MKDTVTRLLLGGIALLLVLVLLRPTASAGSATVVPTAPGGAGRYQLVRANDNAVFLIDTQTGQCWSRSWTSTFASSGEWSPETPQALATGASKAP